MMMRKVPRYIINTLHFTAAVVEPYSKLLLLNQGLFSVLYEYGKFSIQLKHEVGNIR